MRRLALGCTMVVALLACAGCGGEEPGKGAITTSEDALALAADLDKRYADKGEHPVDLALVESLIETGELGPLEADDRVHSYVRRTAGPGFLLCLVNDSSGGFAYYDSAQDGLYDQGTIAPVDAAGFDSVCDPTLVN